MNETETSEDYYPAEVNSNGRCHDTYKYVCTIPTIPIYTLCVFYTIGNYIPYLYLYLLIHLLLCVPVYRIPYNNQ